VAFWGGAGGSRGVDAAKGVVTDHVPADASVWAGGAVGLLAYQGPSFAVDMEATATTLSGGVEGDTPAGAPGEALRAWLCAQSCRSGVVLAVRPRRLR
jgi:hypothetical protein